LVWEEKVVVDQEFPLDLLHAVGDLGVEPPSDAALISRISRALEPEIAGPPKREPRRSGPSRRPWRTVGLGTLSVLVVAAVVVIAVGVGHRGGSSPAARPGHSVTLVYRMAPTPQMPRLTDAAIDRELSLIRGRLRGQSVKSQVTRVSADEIKVMFSSPHLNQATAALIERRVTASDSIQFYDWEANALLPNGKTVANALPAHTPRALTISQGTTTVPPGLASAGGMTLYEAAKLAARQAAAPTSGTLSRLGAEYFAFGAPGSRACATAATVRGLVSPAGTHCYLAGPASTPTELQSELPHGVPKSDGILLTIPQGTVVLQSQGQGDIGVSAPAARFFVLRDRVALSGAQLTNPHVGHEAGEPVVQFGFTARGAKAFQSVTSTLAHRGQIVSDGPDHLFQHFAVALNGTLLTVPRIDFTKYPDGVVETKSQAGAEIFAGTLQQARQIVTQLRLGALPLTLDLVSQHS
jgi:hypothetical protein